MSDGKLLSRPSEKLVCRRFAAAKNLRLQMNSGFHEEFYAVKYLFELDFFSHNNDRNLLHGMLISNIGAILYTPPSGWRCKA